ncbi:MAG: MarC family protein [Candidatus Omnitrophica bacterium]|nr:MarC family protein [Candidatus Omnitrophota bacterium]
MTDLFDFAVLSFASLFVIVDPIGIIPAFLAMTQSNTATERWRMARLASLTTFGILILSFLVGQELLRAFGITLPAFEIAGGIVLLLVALDMLQARPTAIKETQEEKAEGISKEDIAITPLAIPMLAGPGAITAVILLSQKATTFGHQIILAINVFLVSCLTFLVLGLVAFHSQKISVIALKITGRLMGLLLAAIAVQFVLNGLAVSGLLE